MTLPLWVMRVLDGRGDAQVAELHPPPGRSMMFAGFTSRWTMPFLCEWSSAAATPRRIRTARPGSIGPRRSASGATRRRRTP